MVKVVREGSRSVDTLSWCCWPPGTEANRVLLPSEGEEE